MTVPRFWREIPQRYTLQGCVCGSCQEVFYPPRPVCPKCRRASIGNMEPINLTGKGEVVEWTLVHKAAAGFEAQVPYFLALIKTAEGPTLMGQIVDRDTPPRIGMKVSAVFRKLGSDGDAGVIHYGMKWAPDYAAGEVSDEPGEDE